MELFCKLPAPLLPPLLSTRALIEWFQCQNSCQMSTSLSNVKIHVKCQNPCQMSKLMSNFNVNVEISNANIRISKPMSNVNNIFKAQCQISKFGLTGTFHSLPSLPLSPWVNCLYTQLVATCIIALNNQCLQCRV